MRPFSAEIICTGSELLCGKLNTYVPLFHEKLFPLGFELTREQSCGDGLEEIADCLEGALKRADLVLVCGGLGPTFDDLTRQAASRALKIEILNREPLAASLKKRYGVVRLSANLKNQCLMLEGAKVLMNRNGTAPGQEIRLAKKMVVLLPGPRNEWEPMFEDYLNKDLRSFFGPVSAGQQMLKLKISGAGEAAVEKMLLPVIRHFKDARYTILAGPRTVDFIVRQKQVRGKSCQSRSVSEIEKACRKILGNKIYGVDEDTPASSAGKLLTAKRQSLSCAESCTGGLLAALITDVPGSSAYFKGSAVVYSNQAKQRLLGVSPETLRRHGAVSERCAREMAAGAKNVFCSHYALAVTGIAGPGGAVPGKPAGTVCIALADPDRTVSFTRRFYGSRSFIRHCAANFALDELRKIIELRRRVR